MAGKSCLLDFEKILFWQQLILKSIGLDYYSSDFQYTPLTIFVLILVVVFMGVSLIDLYLFRSDIFNFTFVLVTFFYGVVGTTRIIVGLSKTKFCAKMIQEAKLTYQYASDSDQEQQVLWRTTKLLKQSTISYSIIFIGGCLLAAFIPLAIYLWNGEKIFPFGTMVPLVDPTTPDGYQLTYMYQISCMLWAPVGLTASQNMYLALLFNICIQYDLLMVNLGDADRLIEANRDGALEQEIRGKLKQIVNSQQRLSNFIAQIENLFSVQIFVEVSSNALQIVVTLFVMNVEIWMPGYLLLLVSTFQLFLVCILGTMIDIKSDQFSERVYNIPWHKMRNSEQKMIRFMLESSQRSQRLTYGGMIPINMNLFLSVAGNRM
ncbi:putative odorant receptor 83c [Topomyia yanbarensis]|uniref:putative odorant receptor 83c n=1 Tax=Topomyia yanbarensis TaxID=2498891 RepID=UPI00273BD538|nr:putative odorant receptor 83c [Topomyia yanbarensis]